MRFAALVFLWSISSNSFASFELPNYFMTQEERQQLDSLRYASAQVETPTPKVTEVAQPSLDYEDLNLTAVLEITGKKLVEINGAYFAEGEDKSGIKVHKINTTFIELTYLNIKRKVELGKVYSSEFWLSKTK